MTMRNILASNTNLMASLHDKISAGNDEINAMNGWKMFEGASCERQRLH